MKHLSCILLFVVAVMLFACDDDPTTPTDQNPPDTSESSPCVSHYNSADWPEATVSFKNDIKPLLRMNGCSSIYCHGGAHAYNMLTVDQILTAGPQAETLDLCGVERGNPDNSYMIWKIEGRPEISDSRMPRLRDPMSDEDLALLRLWVEQGAPDN